MPPLLLLASRSPRRAELLQQIGVPFTAVDSDTDETTRDGESLHDYVLRVACNKAHAARHTATSTNIVLAADTAGECLGKRLVKPTDETHALDMLMRMSGQVHTVSTAVCVLSCADNQMHSCVVNTAVHFRTLTREECRRYWQTGEPHDKAGAYAIQGYGGIFVERLEGSYSGVVGLPLFETARLLQRVGIHPWQHTVPVRKPESP